MDVKLKGLPEFECGKLAFMFGFDRDDFDADEHSGPDEVSAWQLGWDDAKAAHSTTAQGDER